MSDTIKFSQKDMFMAIKGVFEGGDLPELMNAQTVVDFCDARLAALAHRAEKSKEYAAKKRAEADTLIEVVYSVLSDEPATVNDVMARLEANGMTDLSRSKVVYRLSALAKDGRATKSEVTVAASEEGGKSKKVVAYAAC